MLRMKVRMWLSAWLLSNYFLLVPISKERVNKANENLGACCGGNSLEGKSTKSREKGLFAEKNGILEDTGIDSQARREWLKLLFPLDKRGVGF